MRKGTKLEQELLKEAHEFAWKHFDFHARQRIDDFKSYLTLVTIMFAGFGVALQIRIFELGVMLCVLSFLLALIFLALEERNKQLVKVSEGYLKRSEARLKKAIGVSEITLFAKSEAVHKFLGMRLSYSKLFRAFFVINLLVSIVMLIIFLTRPSG